MTIFPYESEFYGNIGVKHNKMQTIVNLCNGGHYIQLLPLYKNCLLKA